LSYKNDSSQIITISGSGNFSGRYSNDSKYYLTFASSNITREMKNGTLTINAGTNSINSSFVIDKVLNENTIMLNQPYYTKKNNISKISGFEPDSTFSYTMSYVSLVSQSTATGSSQSFANVELTNLGVFSGQVSRIKTYIKNSQVSDEVEYELINDIAIKNKNLLIDSSSVYSNYVGYFYNKD